MAEPTDDNVDDADDAWAEALAEQADEEGGYESAPMSELVDSSEDSDGDDDSVDLDMVLDIPVTISMEIGRTQISIRNLLKLNQGSVVELDRLAGEPLDVLVNGTLIAHGEVVVVNEKFGIRLTDVITAMERVQKL
jgi:flagellar motor switch protein FliN/FliY